MFSRFTEKHGRPGQEFFLHLGLHKTATTALQEFLQKNLTNLLHHDVRYIPLQRMRADVTPLLSTVDKAKRTKLFSLLESFPNKRILLSDENILGTPGDILSGALYPYARNRVETFCEEAGDRPVTLFLTLREPGAFLTSMYCEFIRHNEFLTFAEYISSFDVDGFSYAHVFRWLGKLPKNTRVHVIPFESSLGGGPDVIMRRIVHELVGQDSRVDFSLFPNKKSRSSFSLEEMELASDIARRAGPRMAQVFLNALDARDKRFGDTRFSPLPPALSELLQARYAEELAAWA